MSLNKQLKRRIHTMLDPVRSGLASLMHPNSQAAYLLQNAPNPADTLGIFRGEWFSKFPPELNTGSAGGEMPLFDDARIHYAAREMGGFEGKHLLELGPFEGAHTAMLERLGAANIKAVEANSRGYLKCLVTKELLHLSRTNFLCGDFVSFLREYQGRFDAAIACGVLYHMRNPVELLSLLCRTSERLFLWTHYYDEAIIARTPSVASRFGRAATAEFEGFQHTLHRHTYGATLYQRKFCGGTAPFSQWMNREDILGCLRHFGMKVVSVAFETDGGQDSQSFALMPVPSFAVVAVRA